MSVVLASIFITIITTIFITINFIAYLINRSILAGRKLWIAIQLWTVVIIPTFFLSIMDLPNVNDCCSDSAIFSPDHRIGIYALMILCTISFVIGVFRKSIMPPIAEVFHNSFLILGVILNILFCKHFTTEGEGCIWWFFGNIPIIMLFLIMLVENQKLLTSHIVNNEYHANSLVGKWCILIIQLDPIFKYPVLTLILVPVLILLSLFLILFGQKPDSIIRAFTDTYKHGFSQLDYMCNNVECGDHFLCSVGANGHKQIVKPIRYGERNGHKIICNRQLLVSNAFEELIQEKYPKLHKMIRHNYNRVGNVVHKHYHIFNIKIVSDIVYVLMKPLEVIFLLTLYSFDRKPENRIASQYLKRIDREKINIQTDSSL